MDLFAEFPQQVGGESLALAHVLDVETVSDDGCQHFGGDSYFSFQEAEQRIVHEVFCAIKPLQFFGQDLQIFAHFFIDLGQPLQLTGLLLLFLFLQSHFFIVHIFQLVQLVNGPHRLRTLQQLLHVGR